MESTTLGITVLDGIKRVCTNGQLIRLEEIASTPGPEGPPKEQGIQGVPSPYGQGGAEGADADMSNIYNKAQFGILFATNTPSSGMYPGQGISARGDAQDLMRILVGQNGFSVLA